MLDATPLQNEHARRGIGAYVRGLLAGLEAKQLSDWGVLAYPGRLPVADRRPRIMPVAPRRPALLEFHGAWVLDQLLLPRRLRGVGLFHATDPRRIPSSRASAVVATVYDLTPLHDATVWQSMWPDQRIGWRRGIANIRRAAAVITISETVAEDAVNSIGIARSRIHVVYPSVSIDSAADGDAAGPRETDHLLFVGAPDPHKNLDLLLRALSTMPESTRPRLTVVGPWSRAAHEDLLGRTSNLGLGRIVIEADIRGTRLASLYRTVTALVVPSRHEGFGLPVLEAMVHGCPVLAADIPVLREVTGGAALHFALDDDALRAAIEHVLAREDTRSRLSVAGRRRSADFDQGRSTDALVACYRSLGYGLAA